jgi:hypothetical protein
MLPTAPNSSRSCTTSRCQSESLSVRSSCTARPTPTAKPARRTGWSVLISSERTAARMTCASRPACCPISMRLCSEYPSSADRSGSARALSSAALAKTCCISSSENLRSVMPSSLGRAAGSYVLSLIPTLREQRRLGFRSGPLELRDGAPPQPASSFGSEQPTSPSKTGPGLETRGIRPRTLCCKVLSRILSQRP